MHFKHVLLAASACALALLLASPASAQTLATPSDGSAYRGALPTRGMSMAQVERRFGAPSAKLPTAGGDSPRHPPINRWKYSGFTVYFERSHVIHSVIDASVAGTSS